MITYNEEKFAELVLYIAAKCEGHERFGATKLNKILFFADFWAYLSRGKPITGAVYQKLKFGPAPKRLLPVQERLIASQSAAKQEAPRVTAAFSRSSPGASYVEKRLIALRRPHLDMFEAQEIAIVDEIIERLRNADAVEVSDGSHEFPGWQLAELNEEIPYFTAHLPREQPALAPEDEEWARRVGRSFTESARA